MAVKSVTAQNVAEFAMARGVTPESEAQAAPKSESEIKITSGEETVSTAPPAEPKKEEPEPKKKGGVQERIDELTREKRELEELAETEFEARLQAQRRVTELEAQVKPKAKEEPEDLRPDRTKYTDPDKYENDLLAWNRRQAVKEFQEADAKRRHEETLQRQQQELQRRTEAARKRIGDFDEVIKRASRNHTEIPNHVQAAILESEVGPELAYHLAKEPDEARRIFLLTPARALLELGKIEAKYTEKTDVDKPVISHTTSQAPPPMPALSGSGEVPTDLSSLTEFDRYKRARIEQIRKHGRRRVHS